MVRETSLVFVFLVLFVPFVAQAETAAQEGTLSATQSNDEIIQLRNAAELGDVNAMFKLGNVYSYGDGVAEDVNVAVEWYRKAAEAGNSDAMYELGDKYYRGEGVTEDANAALEWYRKAAAAGNTKAMYELGNIYYFGESVEQDYAKAMEWFQRAAEAGNPDAMCKIGLMYENGKGVDKDYEQAKAWYKKAIELDGNEAKSRLIVIFLKENYKVALWGFFMVFLVCGFIYAAQGKQTDEAIESFIIDSKPTKWPIWVTVRRYVGSQFIYIIYWLILWEEIRYAAGPALSPDKAKEQVEIGVIESIWEYGWGDHYIWFLIIFCLITYCCGVLAGATAKKKGAVVAGIANLPIVIFMLLLCWFFYIGAIDLDVESPIAWKIIFPLSIFGSTIFSILGGLVGVRWQNDEFGNSTILGIRPFHWLWLWLVSAFYVRGIACALIPIITWSWGSGFGPGILQILYLFVYGYPMCLMYQILTGEILANKNRLIKSISFIGIYLGGIVAAILFELLCLGLHKLISSIF